MQIGTHEVQRELGRGGMGVVYAVTSAQLPEERALKLLTRGADPESRERFRREAELLARIRHPGVVQIHEVGEAEQGLYLVMDLVPGEPLDHVLRRGSVSPEQARAWILEIAEALTALHREGLLHRDLKPANLILRPDGRLVLLDFGLARSAEGSSLTETGSITGSPGFLAPEQARGIKDLTPAVDVHGLGTTLFALLNEGAPPFRGGTTLATVAAVLHEEAAWPPGLPPELLALGERALAKDPSERFPDAMAFAAALRAPAETRAPTRGPLWALAASCGLLLLSAAWAASSDLLRPPATPSPSPAASQVPSQARPWPPLPHRPGERAAWFREAWLRWSAGEVPPLEARTNLRRLQRDPLLSLSVTSDEMPAARFWGPERWLRQRSFGIEWGRITSGRGDEVEGEQALDVGGVVAFQVRGEGLLQFKLGGQPQAWRIPRPGAKPELLRLPPATFLAEGVEFSGYTLGPDRLCMTTPTEAWELDLASPESFQLAYEFPRGLIEEVAYTPRAELVVAVTAVNRAQVCLASGSGQAPLEGVPKSLATHPSLPLVAVGDQNGRIVLWDYSQGATTRLRDQGQTHRVRRLIFDPAGRLLYSLAALSADGARASDESGEVQVWSLVDGAWSATRRIELPWVPDRMDLSPEGPWLLVSRRRGQVHLYAAGDSRGL